MNIPKSTLKQVTARLTFGEKLYAAASRIFFATLITNVMLTVPTLTYVMPVLALTFVAWTASLKGRYWHGLVLPQGYKLTKGYTHRLIGTVAPLTGLGFSLLLVLLQHVLDVKLFGVYLAIVFGIFILTYTFYNLGLTQGWDSVTPASFLTDEVVGVYHAKPGQGEKFLTGVYLVLTFFMALGIVGYRHVAQAADEAQAAEVMQQVSQETATDSAATISTPVAAPAESVMSAPTAPVTPAVEAMTAAAVAHAVPEDNPAEIAAMLQRAQKAAQTSDEDAIDEQYIDPNTSVAMWAGSPRHDGYPSYASKCYVTDKDFCRQYNGAGSAIDASVESLASSLTVVRNADVLSGAYWCGHGVCVDKSLNLVGRVSAAMAQAHPELMQSYQP